MTQAHGLPDGGGLPVPVLVAANAGALTLATTFLVLVLLWRRPRFQRTAGRPLPALTRLVDAPTTRRLLRAVGLLLLVVFLAAAWLGPDDARTNPVPTWFYVWFWIGLVPLSLLAGPVWRELNPLRTLAGLVRRGSPPPGRPVPATLTGWPAEAAILAFLWLELVSDSAGSPRTIGGFVAAYSAVHIVAGARFGPAWFARNDGFEVYSTLFARAAPVARGPDGGLVLRGSFRGLAAPTREGDPTLLILILLGGTAFDGLGGTDLWARLVAGSGRAEYLLLGTAGLVGTIAATVAAYAVAIWATRRVSRVDRDLSAEFAPALVPVAAGYLVAHYLAFVLLQGPQGVVLAGHPFGLGWAPFGGPGAGTGVTLPPAVAALLQVAAIVLGHVVALVCAHDRAVGVLPRRRRRRGQVPMLAVMVLYTMAGIGLLAGG